MRVFAEIPYAPHSTNPNSIESIPRSAAEGLGAVPFPPTLPYADLSGAVLGVPEGSTQEPAGEG